MSSEFTSEVVNSSGKREIESALSAGFQRVEKELDDSHTFPTNFRGDLN